MTAEEHTANEVSGELGACLLFYNVLRLCLLPEAIALTVRPFATVPLTSPASLLMDREIKRWAVDCSTMDAQAWSAVEKQGKLVSEADLTLATT